MKALLEGLLKGLDKEIILERPMGEPVIIYTYDDIELTDEGITINRTRRILYMNITRIRWKTIFQDKPIRTIREWEEE